jgi:hypothetical protein
MYIIIKLKKTNGHDWYIENYDAPTRLHQNYLDARNEAERLAQKHPGIYFGIFEFDGAAICPIPPVQYFDKGDL